MLIGSSALLYGFGLYLLRLKEMHLLMDKILGRLRKI
jgi:hypothetical protein